MNLTSTSHHDESNDICFDRQDDVNADKETKVKANLDRSSSLGTQAMPQDLTKSEQNYLGHSKKSSLDEKPLLDIFEVSSTPPWRHPDDDIFTITTPDLMMPSSSLQITSIDGFFNRKRGRPPKNRLVEVYKNTQQKPQAIFTSFKLERQDLTDPTTNTINNFLQTTVHTSRNYDRDGNVLFEHCRYKPTTETLPQRNRLSQATTEVLTYSGRSCNTLNAHQIRFGTKTFQNSCTGLEDYKEYMLNKIKSDSLFMDSADAILNNLPNDTSHRSRETKKETTSSFSMDLQSMLKKPRLYEDAENVTVIRAAGTFYPENSIGSYCSNLSENSSNLVQAKSNIFSMRDDLAQNLSLKDNLHLEPRNYKELLRETLSSSTAIDSTTTLPQHNNVFQMQQQLIAFYQQIALVAPAFSQLVHSLGQNQTLSNTSSSLSSPATNSENVLSQNKHSFNMIPSLPRQQGNQSKSQDCVHQLCNKSTTTAVKAKNSSQKIKAISQLKASFKPHKKLPKKQFQYGGREYTPSGYLRYRFNEDCGYDKCGYRHHQSHFHCNRVDCQYSFCDKTRFVQHTARHERLDTLMGNDFQQYRATTACSYSNCPYTLNAIEDVNKIPNNRKTSHFHCLKCCFVCADTSKVVAHRRYHSKMDFIRLAGFRKISSTQNCLASTPTSSIKEVYSTLEKTLDLSCNGLGSSDQLDTQLATPHCPYSMRHAHYHCLVCNCSVLSRSQMLAHKHHNSSVSTWTQQHTLERALLPPENQEMKEPTCETPLDVLNHNA